MGESTSTDGDAPDSGPVTARTAPAPSTTTVTTINSAGNSESGSSSSPKLIEIEPRGDVILDVTFETSPETIRRNRKIALKASALSAAPAPRELKPRIRIAFRVSLSALKQHSKYFANLLSNSQFRESKIITDAHRLLTDRGAKPSEAEPGDLPWLPIADDDEATGAAGREAAFEDMLRIIHQKPPKTARATMPYVTTMAITADRFDCTAAVARCLNTELKFKWPITNGRPMRDDSGRETDVEQTLRQKILVSWLLGQPMRLHNATRELIIRGSSHWSAFYESQVDTTAAWWNLPDGLERELSITPAS